MICGKCSKKLWDKKNQIHIITKRKEWHQLHRSQEIKKSMEWQKNNPEKKKEADKRYMLKNKEKLRYKSKLYRMKNHNEYLRRCRISAKIYRKNNPEKLKLSQLKYKQNHPEKYRELSRKKSKLFYHEHPEVHGIWYQKNKQRLHVLWKKRYLKNRIKFIEISKQYHKEHPEVVLRSKKKLMIRLGIPFKLPGSKYAHALFSWQRTIKKRDDQTCQICGLPGKIAHHLIYKSIVPKLSLNVNNGMTLCMSCHYEVHGKNVNLLVPLVK